MQIAILDDYQDVVRQLKCFELLKDHDVRILTQTYPDPKSLAQALMGVEAIVLIRERTGVTDELLSRLPDLKLISQTGKISQHLDPELCRRYGVKIAEGTGSPIAPAELCWTLVMAASRLLPQYLTYLQAGQWQQSGLGLGRTLQGLKFGIWGYGKIGKRVARYAQAFGMNVLVWGREASCQQALLDGFEVAIDKELFFAESDIVSLHLRLNDQTRGCVSKGDLASMKPDSLFVNISRAELVETGALEAEMQQYPNKRAAVDVYTQEPTCAEQNVLLSLPNVLCSPHLGYVEQNSYELYFKMAFENILAFAAGQPENLLV